MSTRLFAEDVSFEQRLLSCAGFNPGKIDGQYGNETRKAEERAQASYEQIKTELGAFDSRSEKAIITLLPEMQRKARMILKVGLDQESTTGITAVILSGTRTYAEQTRLFNLRPRVTHAGPGQSNHNFGIAIDIGLFKNAHYMTGANASEDKAYADFAALVKSKVHGIEAGIDWVSFKDAPHYQLDVGGKSIKEIRRLFEAGASFTG